MPEIGVMTEKLLMPHADGDNGIYSKYTLTLSGAKRQGTYSREVVVALSRRAS